MVCACACAHVQVISILLVLINAIMLLVFAWRMVVEAYDYAVTLLDKDGDGQVSGAAHRPY